jgi:hypothetical protein
MPTVNVNGYDLFYADDDFVEPWRPHDTILMQHYVLGNHTEYQQWVPLLARLSPGASFPTSLEQQAMMRERIPNCDQVVFDGAQHGIVWDIPEQCAEASLQFIRNHAGSMAAVPAGSR